MIKREQYLNKIRPYMNRDIIKVLTGMRRCGKSVMLELIQQELLENGVDKDRFLAINFESKAVEYVQSMEKTYQYMKEFVESKSEKVYFFLDEIQELEGWEKLINACMIDFDVDIYITGSNAKLLSGELATYLAGRYVEISVYPFSFQEVMLASGEKPVREVFETYLKWGGMPFLYQFPLDERSAKQYLGDIYDSIILKDIIARHKIRDAELLQRVLLYFISNIGNSFSAMNIVKYLKNEQRSISNETIYNYINYGKATCLLHLAKREDLLGKQLLQFQEKIYLADHGIREAVYGNNMRDIQQVLENIVYMELIRRGYEITVGKVDTQEVDFVAKDGAEKIYVQVTYLLATQETVEREFSCLEKIPDNFPKYVVSMDEISRSRNGIKHVNIRDFLLMESY